jgi:uncharacterized protein (TIGR03435 family)
MYTRASVLGSSLISAAALAMLGGSLTTTAQTPAPARREFEVASIRKTDAERPRVYVTPFAFLPGGRFTATSVTLTDVIVMAFKTRRIQMRGGPSGIDSDRFDIVAKADETGGEVKSEQWDPMVQALLEDRFKLVLHRETEERTVYALVPGKTPPKVQPAKEGEQKGMVTGDHGQMNFQGMPLSGLVNTLANILHTPVIDGTGLKGPFDFTLDPLAFSDHTQPITPDSWPDLVLTAVREQLGFKLEKQKASLEITVIDHAEEPTDN